MFIFKHEKHDLFELKIEFTNANDDRRLSNKVIFFGSKTVKLQFILYGGNYLLLAYIFVLSNMYTRRTRLHMTM